MKKAVQLFIALSIPVAAFSQSAKVQTALRNAQDYESSKDVSSLMKAKEAIDLATNNEETKDKPKTWVYRTRVYYDLFKNALEQEEKKVPASVTNKNERLTKAYGAVSTADYEEAGKATERAVALDKDKNYQADLGMIGLQMFNDVNNLAIGKYNAGKYKEAMEFFEGAYEGSKMMGKKDTTQLTNALICAQKEKDTEKIKLYDQKAIDDKVATPYNYYSLFDVKNELKDSTGALQTLQAGRAAFPNDVDLMNRETDYLMGKGKNQEAIANLDKAIAKDPKNASKFYLAKGIAYYSMANPKDAHKKDLDKPKNYDELMGNAEDSYKKSTDSDPKLYEAWYNLGTLYNNWSTDWQKRCDDLIKQATKLKECEAKKDEMLNKAIPAFEKAIEINPGDKTTMTYLRRLYLLTNQPEKAEKMNAKIKGQ
jgi:tetratricopeptide (TPR) repeat protein